MFNIIKILNDFKDGKIKALFYTPSIYNRARTFLFYEPAEVIEIYCKSDWESKRGWINKLSKKFSAGFGLINYEFGYLLEERTINFIDAGKTKPLLKFYFYDKQGFKIINSKKISFAGINKNNFAENLISDFELNISEEEYLNSISKIKSYIAEGDTYQVNYTVKGRFKTETSAEKLFLTLLFNQSSAYSALINNGDEKIISFSPELFFELDGNKIKARPMKGTLRRLPEASSDEKGKLELIKSEKDRAENIMIVDLMRNDIGKISRQSTVQPSSIFEIEKYESLYQMVTTVSAELKSKKITNILEALFPCGSITGAPKLRTMEIIKELEKEKRGIYCGSIGLWHNKKSVFNVAIRTLVINEKTQSGELGIGSGVVIDSDPESEYSEVLLKANFLNKPMPYFELFETMLLENGEIFLLEYHMKRLRKSAAYFLFQFDETDCRHKLEKYISKFDQNRKYRIKIYLNKWGRLNFTVSKFNNSKPDKVKVILSNNRVDSSNKFLYHKTTNREIYDSAKLHDGSEFYETILQNEKGEITEGTFTNIFIMKENKKITPPLSCGLLNGCYRQYLIETEDGIEEERISIKDLLNSEELFIANSLRKKIKVDEIYDGSGKLLKSY